MRVARRRLLLLPQFLSADRSGDVKGIGKDSRHDGDSDDKQDIVLECRHVTGHLDKASGRDR